MNHAGEAKIATATLRCLATALLVVYLVWNAAWLSQGAIPPSLFTALTGLPCPTTGGTRACRCLLAGDVQESLRYNAMAIPLVALFVITAGSVIVQVSQRRKASLSQWLVPAWLVLLAVAWVLKLAGSPGYW